MIPMLPIKVGYKYFYRFESVRPSDGRRTPLTDWFPNSILTSGRNIMADRSDWFDFAVVGTAGTPAPNPSQTGLESFHAGTGNITTDIHGAQGVEPWFGWKRKTWRYLPGTVNTTLPECGVGWTASNGDQTSRALIVDINGDTSEIAPLIDEYLDMTAELRYYPPLTPVNGQVTLNGEVFDTITTASEVSSTAWGFYIGNAMGVIADAASDWQVYDGEPGTIEQAPSGVAAPCDNSNFVNAEYQGNSYEVDMTASCGPTGWVRPSGFRTMRIKTTAGYYQTRFGADGNGTLALDAMVPKDENFTIAFGYTLSWDEQIIP
jgi:hypothetical protein